MTTIRKMTAQDIERVGEIWLEASLLAHAFISADFWRSDLQTMTKELLPQAEGYVHVSGERIDGFISLEGDFIHCLFVEPQRQHQGVGGALLAHVKREHTTLRLKVYQQNRDATAFYESQGFTISGESTCPYTGCAEFEMEWTREPGQGA